MTEYIQKLKSYFENEPKVVMAFLFGSAAKGREMKESDVDLGVWIEDGYSLDDVNKIWKDAEILIGKNIDLIVLNQARPTIGWSALRGKPIIIKDYRLYLRKMLEISSEAEDFQEFVLDFWNLRKKLKGTFA